MRGLCFARGFPVARPASRARRAASPRLLRVQRALPFVVVFFVDFVETRLLTPSCLSWFSDDGRDDRAAALKDRPTYAAALKDRPTHLSRGLIAPRSLSASDPNPSDCATSSRSLYSRTSSASCASWIAFALR